MPWFISGAGGTTAQKSVLEEVDILSLSGYFNYGRDRMAYDPCDSNCYLSLPHPLYVGKHGPLPWTVLTQKMWDGSYKCHLYFDNIQGFCNDIWIPELKF